MKLSRACIALGWLALVPLSVPAKSAPLAILASAKGSVQLLRGGKPTPGRSGALLEAGDVVKVDKGSALIYYNARPPMALGSGRRMTIQPASGEGSATWRKVYSGISSGLERRTVETPGVLRGDRVQSIAPFNTKILESRPVFAWEPYRPDGFALSDYWITVQDQSGASIWQGATRETRIAYPLSAPPLRPGVKYVWNVAPRQLDARNEPVAEDDAVSQSGFFIVSTPEEAKETRAEIAEIQSTLKGAPDEAIRLAVSAALSERGLKGAAIETLLPEIELKTDVRTLRAERWAKMDEASRALLRGLYLDTKRNVLVQEMDAVVKSAKKPVAENR